MGKVKLKKVVFVTFLTVFSVIFGCRPIRTIDLIEIIMIIIYLPTSCVDHYLIEATTLIESESVVQVHV